MAVIAVIILVVLAIGILLFSFNAKSFRFVEVSITTAPFSKIRVLLLIIHYFVTILEFQNMVFTLYVYS